MVHIRSVCEAEPARSRCRESGLAGLVGLKQALGEDHSAAGKEGEAERESQERSMRLEEVAVERS